MKRARQERSILGKGNGKCKGPEVGKSLASLRNRKEERHAGNEAEKKAGPIQEDQSQEVRFLA